MNRLKQLEEAMHEGYLVRFSRRFESGHGCGYVLDIGSRFLVVLVVSDRLWLDGFECFLIDDISNVKLEPYADFIETVLKKRRERKPKRPKLNVATIQELLRSANHAFPLITIHREKIKPDICHIGRIAGMKRGCVSLLEITPGARWEEIPVEYRLSEITRISFGGDYEQALYLVGGEP